jgi:L-2-hydroxycarboxylate dehydrogenase (NAD+)
MKRLTIEEYKDTCSTLLHGAGVAEDDINLLTDAVLFASLRGHDTHGLGHLPMYVRGFLGQRGTYAGVDKNAQIEVVRETPATLVLDGHWAMGHKAALVATERVIEKAKNLGIAAATVYNCTHNGSLGYFVSKIVEQDMIGMAFTCSAAVAPPTGGVERMLGTNPLSMGFPSKDEYPIIFDMATSSTVWAWLMPMIRTSQPIPEGLLLDDQGEPTTDPTAFMGSRSTPNAPIQGAMANMGGGHKGYSIQLAVDILGGILPALLVGTQISTAERFHNPAFIVVIDVKAFQDVEAFKDKIDERIRELKASNKKPGVKEIFLPGEQGMRRRDKCLAENSIPVSDHYWGELTALAEEMGLKLPDLAEVPA